MTYRKFSPLRLLGPDHNRPGGGYRLGGKKTCFLTGCTGQYGRQQPAHNMPCLAFQRVDQLAIHKKWLFSPHCTSRKKTRGVKTPCSANSPLFRSPETMICMGRAGSRQHIWRTDLFHKPDQSSIAMTEIVARICLLLLVLVTYDFLNSSPSAGIFHYSKVI